MKAQNFDEAQELLAASLPGYSRRPHQVALAHAIEQAIDGGGHGLFQAPCGTGKSLAGLIPVITHRDENGFPVRTVVATATKALQNQYIGDLKFLQETLGDFTWALLKGRSNYPCVAKIAGLKSPTRAQSAVLAGIERQVDEDETATPDRESLPPASDNEWQALSMSASECPGAKHCPFARQCFAERAKAKAAKAQVVVTNLAYLLTDLLIRKSSEDSVQLLGEFSQLIIDEAHNLPDAATSALSDNMGEGTFIKLARDAAGFLHDQRRDPASAELIEIGMQALWAQMYQLYRDRNAGNREANPVRLSAKNILDLGEAVVFLTEALNSVRTEIVEVRITDRDDPAYTLRYRLMNRLGNISARLSSVLFGEGMVYWLEVNEITMRSTGATEQRLYLRSAPLSPAAFLREMIWDQTPTVMMSATLAAGRRNGAADFSYLRDMIGLAQGEAAEFDAGSPFDFSAQARLYIPPEGTPEPVNGKLAGWQVFSQQATRKLVLAAGGNALLLYTSRRNLNAAWDALAPQFREAGLTVLKQGDAPTPVLIAELKKGNAVLFGLKTFFEGIDIQGKAVSLVVIDKLPFAVPTDVLVAARAEALVARHGQWADFRMMTIPSMSLVLIQGAGRLVRTVNDRGVIAVLDPRLSTKKYGKQIIASLPPAPVTKDISEAESFLEAHRS
jgi:ATP-dependent DNA helicase DinG